MNLPDISVNDVRRPDGALINANDIVTNNVSVRPRRATQPPFISAWRPLAGLLYTAVKIKSLSDLWVYGIIQAIT